MVHYGSSILAYACCFDMKDAVIALLKTGFADLNRREDGCHLTGLMPLHAVVANSLYPPSSSDPVPMYPVPAMKLS